MKVLNWMLGHVLESATVLSIASEDMAAFERSVTQLKPYYGAVGTPSALHFQILGTRLLQLLVENRMAEFHNEVRDLFMLGIFLCGGLSLLGYSCTGFLCSFPPYSLSSCRNRLDRMLTLPSPSSWSSISWKELTTRCDEDKVPSFSSSFFSS